MHIKQKNINKIEILINLCLFFVCSFHSFLVVISHILFVKIKRRISVKHCHFLETKWSHSGFLKHISWMHVYKADFVMILQHFANTISYHVNTKMFCPYSISFHTVAYFTNKMLLGFHFFIFFQNNAVPTSSVSMFQLQNHKKHE